ncbi:MAG: hypothetical protein QOE78_3993 [Alphaproteobacteria bacterium]|nr:hypothetical protein [Alphaproteobacteria bacterium]
MSRRGSGQSHCPAAGSRPSGHHGQRQGGDFFTPDRVRPGIWMKPVGGEQVRAQRSRKALDDHPRQSIREPIGRRLQRGGAPAENASQRPGQRRKGQQRGDAPDDDSRIADAIARGGHELGQIIGEGGRRPVAGGIVDAKRNDHEIRRFRCDARHQALQSVPDGRPGQAARTPRRRPPGVAGKGAGCHGGYRLVPTGKTDTRNRRLANPHHADRIAGAGHLSIVRRIRGRQLRHAPTRCQPCAQASGDSASDPTRPVTIVERDTWRGAEGGSRPMIEHWAYGLAETRNWSRSPQPSDHRLITPDLLHTRSPSASPHQRINAVSAPEFLRRARRIFSELGALPCALAKHLIRGSVRNNPPARRIAS